MEGLVIIFRVGVLAYLRSSLRQLLKFDYKKFALFRVLHIQYAASLKDEVSFATDRLWEEAPDHKHQLPHQQFFCASVAVRAFISIICA